MGVMAAAVVAGLAAGAGGAWMGADAAQEKRNELMRTVDRWLPDMDKNTAAYYADVAKYMPAAQEASRSGALADQATIMAMQEKAIPGFGAARNTAAGALFPLLQGQLPPEVMAAFQRSGAASSVGAGLGGSGLGFLNQALFGARGQLGAMQLGYGLLPGLLSMMPMAHSPGTAAYLQPLLTPEQRTNEQLAIRSQNIGIHTALAGMPTGGDMWAKYLSSTGGMLTGAGMMGLGAGGEGAAMGGGGGGGVPKFQHEQMLREGGFL